LVPLRILPFRLHGERARHERMHVLSMTAHDTIPNEAKSHQQSLEVPKRYYLTWAIEESLVEADRLHHFGQTNPAFSTAFRTESGKR
jgi:hypothetical protein